MWFLIINVVYITFYLFFYSCIFFRVLKFEGPIIMENSVTLMIFPSTPLSCGDNRNNNSNIKMLTLYQAV